MKNIVITGAAGFIGFHLCNNLIKKGENIIGIDAAMFVKMSSTEKKHKTILQPGAKWIFGAFSFEDGSGTGVSGDYYVNKKIVKESENFVERSELEEIIQNLINNSSIKEANNSFVEYEDKDFAWHIKIKLFRYIKKPIIKFYKTYPDNPYLHFHYYANKR